jgi:hypothetical protein
MDRENFPNPVQIAALRMARALDTTTKDELAAALRWTASQSHDQRIGTCYRDTFKHLARLMRKDLKQYR